jgi:hypothetical protein
VNGGKMPVLPSDVVRVDVIGDMNTTNEVVNTYQFQYNSGVTLTDSDFMTDMLALIDALYTAAKAVWTSVVIFRRIRAYNLTAGTLLGEAPFAAPIVGTLAGEQGAFQVAGLTSFKTTLARVTMRKYLPIGEGAVDSVSRLSGPVVTALNTFGTTLLNPIVVPSGRVYRFGYLSPKAGGFIAPTSRQVSLVAATQRRRKPGVGS